MSGTKVILFAAIFVAFRLPAQEVSLIQGQNALTPGGELENYARYLQTSGLVQAGPWTLRGFSRNGTGKLFPAGENPWQLRFVHDSAGRWLTASPLPIATSTWVNTGFPYGMNDGAVWAGRGVTTAVSAGAVFNARGLFLRIAPVAFWAQNSQFPLAPTALTGVGIFAAPQLEHSTAVDLPQRFGNSAYAQFDLGDSEIQFETPWLRVGLANAHEVWGPATDYPFILGTNAAGFPHAVIATEQPLNIGIGTLSARTIYGMLSQSKYSPVSGPKDYSSIADPGTRRFATGLIAAFTPRGAAGLELGAARFYHLLWPQSGLPRSYFTKPFEGFLKTGLAERNSKGPADMSGSANQLASVFARWSLPHSGAEFYFEYGREDHAYDFRDLLNEIDHSRSYMLGARKIIFLSGQTMSAIRAELINFQLPTTARHRDEGGIYLHGFLKQGHTQKGQLLGAPVGVGAAAGSTIAYDRYSRDGRWTVKWVRTLNQEAGRYFLTGTYNPSAIDVSHALGIERLRFGRVADISTGVNAVREFNRNFAGDAVNLNIYATVHFKRWY